MTITSGMLQAHSTMGYDATTQTTNSRSEKVETSFSAQIEKSVEKKSYTSATEDFKKRHPEETAHVDSQVQAGKNVLRKNGAENVCRDDMTMDEYKKFITGLMDSIPYDSSQKNDVNVWSITEAGWEQMKNDPDYEAWILGYTAEDRAVNIPFASMPGYSSAFHTEHFGASLDEHLGQGVPMNNSVSKKSSSDEESWWDKRQKKMKDIAKQQEEIAHKKAVARKKEQEEWIKAQTESRNRIQNYLNERVTEAQSENGNIPTDIVAAMQSYESTISTFSNSTIENI